LLYRTFKSYKRTKTKRIPAAGHKLLQTTQTLSPEKHTVLDILT